MISTATQSDRQQIHDITARAGVFNQEEVDSVPAMFDEYLTLGAEASGYHLLCIGKENRYWAMLFMGIAT